ncbi:TPA: IS21-like element helper ATPase IstB [Legionella pneumophila]|nr:IS21-like element helper ATPase IstB [Legionella pneumophila]HDS3856845.1 IS21-like element helper ATPase IstB [Legionella pneumophila]HDS3863322.1 IS21-like element helper ATPase IstB [Legionella pneumophila]
MLEHTKQQIASLRLNGFLAALEEQCANPPYQLSFEERLALLIDRELVERDNQKLKNRLKQAKLKPNCSMEQIDYQATRTLKKAQILALMNMSWITLNRTILITGPTGVGKTFIAQALAHKACLHGYTARYYRLLHLMHEVSVAYHEGALSRFLTTMNKADVLIIDDFGMLTMDAEQKRLLLELLEHRYEQKATIITSQLVIEDWYEYINDPLIADAILDRIIHHAEKIIIDGDSLRKNKPQSAIQG